MKLTCVDCARLPRCASAPRGDLVELDTHFCDEWAPTHPSVNAARDTILTRFGLAGARGITKEKNIMYDLPTITSMVENGDLAGLEKLRTDTTTQPTVLMLVASKLTGDAQTIAARLRELKENDARRNYLVDMIVGCVQTAAEADSISAAKAAEAAEAAEAAPAQEEAPAPRKRRSRKQAEAPAEDASAIEIAKAKEAEKATTPEPAPAKTAPSVTAATADMTPVLDAIAKQHADLMAVLTAVNTLGSQLSEVRKEVSALNARVDSIEEQALSATTASAKGLEAVRADAARLNNNLSRVKAAFEGFEIELIGSGTIAATPFAENCADWE